MNSKCQTLKSNNKNNNNNNSACSNNAVYKDENNNSCAYSNNAVYNNNENYNSIKRINKSKLGKKTNIIESIFQKVKVQKK